MILYKDPQAHLLPEDSMRFPFDFPLHEATFLERPNRFVTIIRRSGESEPVKAHVADPGRLKELLLPEARLLVRDHGLGGPRKLRYTVALVQSQEGHWVSINSQLPNRLAAAALASGILPGYEETSVIRREVTYLGEEGTKSRFDFLIRTPASRQCLVEVKGVSLVEAGVARFPDAPTARGARHVRELAEATRRGYEARVLFIVQRHDPVSFEPHALQDPAFAQALDEAIRAGVQVNAYRFEMTPTHCRFAGEIPVNCPPGGD